MRYITLSNSLSAALVDDEDYDRLVSLNWYEEHGYAVTGHHDKRIQMANLILNVPQGLLVDHWDRNPLNNQRYNLRPSTRSQNAANCKIYSNNKSGYKGVVYHSGRWQAQIRVNGKKKTLGTYDTKEEAADRYDRAAKQYFGDFARTNEEQGLNADSIDSLLQ